MKSILNLVIANLLTKETVFLEFRISLGPWDLSNVSFFMKIISVLDVKMLYNNNTSTSIIILMKNTILVLCLLESIEVIVCVVCGVRLSVK